MPVELKTKEEARDFVFSLSVSEFQQFCEQMQTKQDPVIITKDDCSIVIINFRKETSNEPQ